MTEHARTTFYRETDVQETAIGKVPRDWKIAKLMDVTKCRKGRTPKSFVERTEHDSLPYLGAESLRTGEFAKWVRKTDDIVKVYKDDVILIWDGYYCGDSFTGYEGALSSTMVKVETKNLLNRKFLFYFLKTYFTELNSKISGMYLKHVSKKVFESLLVPLPSILEQQRIADVLSCIDLAIQKTDEVIAKTERLKKGLMQKVLTEGIGHKEFKDTEIGKIPSEWKVIRIEDLGEVVTGTTPLTKVKEYWDGEYPFVTPTDFTGSKYVYSTERKVTRKGIEKARLIPRDSVLVVCIGSTIGKVAMSIEDCITNQQINSIICRNETNPHYVYYLMLFRKKKLKEQAGITAKPIVKKSLFEKIQLPRPEYSEQKAIADMLSTLDTKLEIERKQNLKFERIKQRLMDLLLTGEVRVKVD